MGAMERASVILIRYLLQTVFIYVDMRIREGALFCNSLCDFKPPYTGQVIYVEYALIWILSWKIAFTEVVHELLFEKIAIIVYSFGLKWKLLYLKIYNSIFPFLSVEIFVWGIASDGKEN